MKAALLLLLASTGLAAAEPAVQLSTKNAHPGDPVLVTVTGTRDEPRGTAGAHRLHFFPARHGYQAVFAVPLEGPESKVAVEIAGVKKPVSVHIQPTMFPETSLVVEEEMANPTREDGKRIDEDNAAIAKAYEQATGEAQFRGRFARPAGKVTSRFGEWRTFNDGHRAQHLGVDFIANEGTRVHAVAGGTVSLVRETFLAGNVVVVAHGGGISSLYFHLQKAEVAEGDKVAAGDTLGRAGQTGRTTGPHLHLSIHVPGGMVNPLAFVKLALQPGTVPDHERSQQARHRRPEGARRSHL